MVSVNLDPASDPAADRTTPYSTVHFAGTTTPDATVTFLDQAGGSTTAATADSTGAYSIMVPLVSGSNTFTVTTQDGIRAVDQRRDLAGRLLAAKRPETARRWPRLGQCDATPVDRLGHGARTRPAGRQMSRRPVSFRLDRRPRLAAQARRRRERSIGIVLMAPERPCRLGSDLAQGPRRRGAHHRVFFAIIEPVRQGLGRFGQSSAAQHQRGVADEPRCVWHA